MVPQLQTHAELPSKFSQHYAEREREREEAGKRGGGFQGSVRGSEEEWMRGNCGRTERRVRLV